MKPKTGKRLIAIVDISCYIIVIATAIVLFLNFTYCRNINAGGAMANRYTLINKEEISQGYTLLAPMTNYQNVHQGGAIYLADLFGSQVHQWKTEYSPFYAILKKNGNIVAALVDPENNVTPGFTGVLHELDWKSNVVWEYKNKNLRLDFDVLPNDNIAAVMVEKVPDSIARQIKGGYPPTEYFRGDVLSDRIIEINKSGSIVWEWHAFEHLNPQEHSLGPLDPRSIWPYINSIKYVAHDPFENDEAFLISMRAINTVALIKKSNGKIIWASPKSMLAHQHDATLLPTGNILVFDNNMFREPSITDYSIQYGSRVVEIDPKTNSVVWEFTGGKSGLERARFIAELTSGAQRLENGNTLIINGPLGHLIEATPENRVVWEMDNPFSTFTTAPWPNNALFKARKYGHEEINWPEKLPSPMPGLSLACIKLNSIFR